MSNKDQAFNWVTRRGEYSCGKYSVRHQYDLMRRDASELVETRKPQLADRKNRASLEIWRQHDSFEVLIDRIKDGRTESLKRSFRLEAGRIKVFEAVDASYTITLTLNDKGDCRFKIDGEGCYLRWQVLKHFLEPLFSDK